MVCGASGTGRTTFVNTLCGKQVLGHKQVDDPTVAHVEEGVKIKPITVGTSATIFLRVWRPLVAGTSLVEATPLTLCPQSSRKKAHASHLPLSIPLASVTRSTTRLGRRALFAAIAPAYRYTASQRSSDTSSDSTMASSPRSRVSSVILDSETTASTSSCTSSHRLAMGMLAFHLLSASAHRL